GHVRMFERIAGAVDAGRLAVPDPEHAVDGRASPEMNLLAAPDGRRGEVFIQAGLEMNVVLVEEALCAGELLIIAPERGAAIAGDEAAGVVSRAAVSADLVERQPDKCLRARQKEPSFFRRIFIVQRYAKG